MRMQTRDMARLLLTFCFNTYRQLPFCPADNQWRLKRMKYYISYSFVHIVKIYLIFYQYTFAQARISCINRHIFQLYC